MMNLLAASILGTELGARKWRLLCALHPRVHTSAMKILSVHAKFILFYHSILPTVAAKAIVARSSTCRRQGYHPNIKYQIPHLKSTHNYCQADRQETPSKNLRDATKNSSLSGRAKSVPSVRELMRSGPLKNGMGHVTSK
jgi:hypothetical protein